MENITKVFRDVYQTNGFTDETKKEILTKIFDLIRQEKVYIDAKNISGMMTWSETEEGHVYWAEINETIILEKFK